MLELIIKGTPVSAQTRSRPNLQAWKQNVSQQARNQLPANFTIKTDELKVTYVYYHMGTSLDVDNFVKPIQDAMNGVVYHDDSQITDIQSLLRDVTKSFKVQGMSIKLAEGFSFGNDFIYIRVEDAPDHEEIV